MRSRQTKYKWILAGVAMIASLVASVLFSGCGSSMPECDDKQALDLLTQLDRNFQTQQAQTIWWLYGEDFKQRTQQGGYTINTPKEWVDLCKYKFDAFRMESIDEKTKKISCKAKATYTHPMKDYEGPTDTISYTVQLTQDGQVYVEHLGYN